MLHLTRDTTPYLENVDLALVGDYQRLNLPGVLAVLDELRRQGFVIPEAAVREGLRNVRRLTGFRGRWTILGRQPLVVCDTGHNEAGISFITGQLARLPYRQLHFVLGVVNDKDVSKMLSLLPQDATYYFCQASIPRALPAGEVAERAAAAGLHGQAYGPVSAAVAAARAAAEPDDVVFIGVVPLWWPKSRSCKLSFRPEGGTWVSLFCWHPDSSLRSE
ncbi:glutamate ligase domain-containing protein [Hymenobacter sp. 5516J-16]|uniref:glutamate ligase domain-containing protein n=1 Tax=Hymenobacter sp. 5516J-16 TaxID=2932253 RepID=UPI00293F549A|nr:hypothetical protein [Hymenobacter sp. 5516J-16]